MRWIKALQNDYLGKCFSTITRNLPGGAYLHKLAIKMVNLLKTHVCVTCDVHHIFHSRESLAPFIFLAPATKQLSNLPSQ